MKVLVTGAAGHVATLAMPGLQHHELRLVDLRQPAALPKGASFQALSLLQASDAELAALFRGVEAVVHSAYIPSAERDVYSVSPPQIERFDAEFDNIRMANRVYRCALEAGVRRVVVVSSNHAADWYEHNEVHSRRRETVYPTDYPLADNFYGWSKASYELLAYPYACGTFGRRMEFVMLRIGSPYPIDVSRYEPDAAPAPSSLPRPRGKAAFKRALGAWLSDARLRAALWLRARCEAGAARRCRALGGGLRDFRQHAGVLVARVGPPGAGLLATRRFRSGPCRRRAPVVGCQGKRQCRPPGTHANHEHAPRMTCFLPPHSHPSVSSQGSSMLRRFLLSALVLAAGALALPALAAYPEKPIRLIVPSAPGGAPDALMRALAQQLSQQMGVPIVIDNKPGGSYTIGTMELVHAAPDGYTLAYGNVVSLATNRSLLPNVPYDVDRDLTLVSNALKLSNLMIVNNSLPVKSVAELIDYAKKNPGKLAFGSDGNGTTAHLGVELFKAMTGVHMLHVPYRAATSAMTDLMGGGLQLMMVNTPVSGPPAQAGRVRAIGISSPQRSPTYPDVPAIAETVPGFEVTAWGGIIGPANLPKDIVAKLNAEIRTALASPAVRERFKTLGADPDPSTPEEFLAAIAPRDRQVGQDRQVLRRQDRLRKQP